MNTLEEENVKLRADLNDAKEILDLYFSLFQDQVKLVVALEENNQLIYEKLMEFMGK